MKTVLTAECISKGGRSGSVHSSDGAVDFTLGNPLDKSAPQEGPTPEALFASAYAACFNSAVSSAAKKLAIEVNEPVIRAVVRLTEMNYGGYRLFVELHAQMPGVEPADAQRIMEEAHKGCPYSKALRGDDSVELVVDALEETAQN